MFFWPTNWFCLLNLYIICYTNNYCQQLFDYLSFEELVVNLCGSITNIPCFNSRAEFWAILFWLLIILSQISIISSWYARSSTVPLIFLKKCALKILGSDWALSKSSFMLFSEIWFFILVVGTWKTLTLLLLLTALKNKTESVIIDFPMTTCLPAKHLIVPPVSSTTLLPWLAAKKSQSIWMSVSACNHGNAAAMYRFLNWLDRLSDQIWTVFRLSINKLWRIFLTKRRINCLECETPLILQLLGGTCFFAKSSCKYSSLGFHPMCWLNFILVKSWVILCKIDL